MYRSSRQRAAEQYDKVIVTEFICCAMGHHPGHIQEKNLQDVVPRDLAKPFFDTTQAIWRHVMFLFCCMYEGGHSIMQKMKMELDMLCV